MATVERVGHTPSLRGEGGRPAAVLKGGTRARIGSGVTGPGAALWVEVDEVDDVVSDRARGSREYKRLVVAVLQRREAWQVIDTVHQMSDPSAIADAAGWAPYLSTDRKRELLEDPTSSRGWRSWSAGPRPLAEAELTDKIGEDVREGMEKQQREYLLRQQLAAIRKELGEGEPRRRRLPCPGRGGRPARPRAGGGAEGGRQARAVQRAEPRGRLDPHLARHRPRAAVGTSRPGTRTTSSARAPCSTPTTTAWTRSRTGSWSTSRSGARAERGLQVSAVGLRRRRAARRSSGVGKTSLGESVARALGRKLRPGRPRRRPRQAEIRGHRRTYVGALPGPSCGPSRRPVDEPGRPARRVDKVGSDYRGDPSAALLEVLDPAQNHTFRDHYLGWTSTSPTCCSSPPPTWSSRSRPPCWTGWSSSRWTATPRDDKVAIARDFLLPRQLERTAVTESEVTTDAALRDSRQLHPPEPGVRQLERLLARCCCAKPRLAGRGVASTSTVDDLVALVGRPRFTPVGRAPRCPASRPGWRDRPRR